MSLSKLSSGDNQLMDMDADEPELQRNSITDCKEVSPLSEIPNLTISDQTSDSPTKGKDLSPVTPGLVQALHSEDVTMQMQATKKFNKLLCVIFIKIHLRNKP